MTPKDKAKEMYGLYNQKMPWLGRHFKKIACLLCVDEIINANPTEYNLVGTSGPDANYDAHYRYENNEAYWQQVKEELQKM